MLVNNMVRVMSYFKECPNCKKRTLRIKSKRRFVKNQL